MRIGRTFIVESVRYFVADYNPDAAIVKRFGKMLTVEKWLQDSSGEYCNRGVITSKMCFDVVLVVILKPIPNDFAILI